MSRRQIHDAIGDLASAIESDYDGRPLGLVGIHRGGVPIAERISDRIGGARPPVGVLDVRSFRDDGPRPPLSHTRLDSVADHELVLIDDVLFTGRTVAAAFRALTAYGARASVRLAVLVDRGHREVPIKPDYVGKHLPTRRDAVVSVTSDGAFIGEVPQ